MLLHILLGVVVAGGSVGYYSRYPFPTQMRLWRLGLVIAALIYIGFALPHGFNTHFLLEVGGVLIYGGFAFLSLHYGLFWLAAGWGLHVLWDITLHQYLGVTCAPVWYQGACLGFDLVIAGYILYQISSKKKEHQKPMSTSGSV